jgi:FkbM family methyltransferase
VDLNLSLRRAFTDLTKGGLNFFLSGLAARFSRRPTVRVRLPAGMSAMVRSRQSDFGTLRQIFRDNEYELPERIATCVRKELERILNGGGVPVVVDAGANIGAASIWFKTQFPEAAIVAIEPDPDNAAVARQNIAPLAGVTLLEAAVGGERGFVAVGTADYGWAVQTERASSGCPVVTIDEAILTVPNGKPFVVKIDIEGFESDLFAGDLGWLDEVFLVYIEPHDWMLPSKGTSRNFQRAFGNRDFELHLRGENLVYMRRL